jgi:hypothetical protein
MTPNERAQYIYNACRNAGITRAGAIGLLGNLQGEASDFDPMSVEGMSVANSYLRRIGLTEAEYTRRADAGEPTFDGKYFIKDSKGYGIAQWTWWARKKNLLDFSKSRGTSVGNLDTQIAFMLKEMQIDYTKTWNVLKSTDSILAAVQICVTDYEKPTEQQSAITRRYNYALEWNKVISDVAASPAPTPTPDPKPTTPSVRQYDRQRVIDMMASQIGYLEKRSNAALDDPKANYGTANYNKFARDLDALGNFYNGPKNGFAYCDITVDWSFVAAYGVEAALYLLCQPLKSSGAGCKESARYYDAQGRFNNTPEIGAQAFFPAGTRDFGHTGLVVEIDGDCIWTIEGNTIGKDTDGRYYEGVFKKMHYRSEIGGYGHPAYNDGYGTDAYIGKKTEPIPTPDPEPTPTPAPAPEPEKPVEPTPTPQPEPKPEPKPTEPEFNPPVFKRSSKGTRVKKLQALLKYSGFSIGWSGIDGDFGAATEKAVKRVQAKLGRTQDGVADKYVWAYLSNN